MVMKYGCHPKFTSGDKVYTKVAHPPEILPGEIGVVVSPHVGRLYEVRLPNGELHRWLAGFELKPIGRRSCARMYAGDKARVLDATGHPPQIKVGQIVTIRKSIYTPFYDLEIHDKYHRWFAEDELGRVR